jgi:hypothetical protein
LNSDETWLRETCITAEGPYLRPFQPNPQWRTARVFLVGTNPATPLREEFSSFDEYWQSLTVNPEAFYERYRTKHAKGESKTTGRARLFLEQLKPINYLVTNAFAYPARRASEIPGKRMQQQIGIAIFDRLVRLIQPAAALFHGAEALQLAQVYFRTSLDPYASLAGQDVVAPIPGTDSEVRLYSYPHFSGQGVRAGFRVGLMDQELSQLANKLNQELRAA